MRYIYSNFNISRDYFLVIHSVYFIRTFSKIQPRCSYFSVKNSLKCSYFVLGLSLHVLSFYEAKHKYFIKLIDRSWNLHEILHGTYICVWYAKKCMILLVQKSENCCHLDVHPKSQPRNVLKMFLVFQEIEPIVLINVFLYKKRSVVQVSVRQFVYVCLSYFSKWTSLQ